MLPGLSMRYSLGLHNENSSYNAMYCTRNHKKLLSLQKAPAILSYETLTSRQQSNKERESS